ncbi:hypothetical protein T10_5683 [Trichinella papuae]|uniref:Uncharacterized protein n=1 Tax=Trichinella papuae TaxID=268474 RepID=A0A0V1LYP2_9BILA|nr:hypothetical protein T10_5683 [Trichinella papuae]
MKFTRFVTIYTYTAKSGRKAHSTTPKLHRQWSPIDSIKQQFGQSEAKIQ